MSNQVPPGPGQPPYPGSEPPYGPYSSQAPGVPPPPPGSSPPGEPQGAPPSYGQPPTYGPEPSYGPAPQPYGQPSEPSYGPPPGPEQPQYGGYDPVQPAYGAGYQPGQGQYQQGGYAPSYGGGPAPGAPKGGSGGKIVAIAAGAVVLVGLVVGGVILLTRDNGDPAADRTTSASPKTSSASPKPTRSGPTRTASTDRLDPQALAEAAFPAAAGYEYTCHTGSDEYSPKLSASCYNSASEHYAVILWDDVATARSSILGAYSSYQEVPWSGGTDYVWEASSGIFYDVVRCYSDAPVCVEIFVDTKGEAETSLGHLTYLDAAEIAALNDKLDGGGT